MSERIRKVDISLGEIQCPYLTPNGHDGALCCALKDGHEGAHMTCYEADRGWNPTPAEKWYLPEPWPSAPPAAPTRLEYPWTLETMEIINRLTPDIHGKAFDPDWFLLRQRFEQLETHAEQELEQLRRDLEHMDHCWKRSEDAKCEALRELAQVKAERDRLLTTFAHRFGPDRVPSADGNYQVMTGKCLHCGFDRVHPLHPTEAALGEKGSKSNG